MASWLLCGNGASLSLSSREETPLFPTIIVLFLLRRVSSTFPNWTSPKVDSVRGADVLVGSLVSARSSSHTSVAFFDIQKAFDTSWVEGTLVRLFDAGVRGRMWSLMCNFLHGAQSQVRCRSSLSDPLLDSGTAQGRVLSPLVSTSKSTASSRLCDKLPLVCSSVPRPRVFQVSCLPMILSCLRSASLILQVALDAVARWGRHWRFRRDLLWPSPTHAKLFFPPRPVLLRPGLRRQK